MATDGISVNSPPRDLMASTNSERAVVEGCSDPRRRPTSSFRPRRHGHTAASPWSPGALPGSWSFQREVAMTRSPCSTPHAARADTRPSSADGGRRRKRPKIRPLGERHLEVESGQSLLKITPRGGESHTVLWAVGSLQLAEQGDARPRPGAA